MGCICGSPRKEEKKNDFTSKLPSHVEDNVKREDELSVVHLNAGTIKTTFIETIDNQFFLKKQIDVKDPEKLKMFDDEMAQIAEISRLSPNLSLLRLVDTSKERFTYTMKFKAFPNFLSEVLKEKNPVCQNLLSNIRQVFISLIETLCELSKKGIHHYNINPANLIVSPKPDLKLFNFIIPESYNKYSDLQCPDNQIIVYPNSFQSKKIISYLAPEVENKDSAKYDPDRLDLYALGLCMIQIINSENPEMFNLNNLVQLIDSSGITKDLKDLLRKIVDKNPFKRPKFEICLRFLNYDLKVESFELPDPSSDEGYASIVTEYEDYTKRVYNSDYISFIKEWTCYYWKNEKGRKNIAKHIEKMEGLSRNASATNFHIKIYDSGELDNRRIIVNETYDNSFMTVLMENRKKGILMNEVNIWDLFTPLFYSFKAMADQKIYHRNIHPDVFLITKANKVKISNFWVEGNEYSDGERYFTYLAPELQEPEFLPIDYEIDYEKADVFSLGLTILQMISLEDVSSFSKRRENHKLLKIVKALDVNDRLKELLERCLAIKPEDRYNFVTFCKLFFEGSPNFF